MHRGWKLGALAVLAVAGMAVEGWAFADGSEEKRTKEKFVVRTDDGDVHVLVSEDEGPFEVMTFGEEGEGGAYLGISTREETKLSEGGARVTAVFPETPAEKAGLQKGDVIVSADGKPVRGPGMLTERIHAAKPGDRMSLEIVRDGSRKTLTAELEERKGMRIVMPHLDSKAWSEMAPEEREKIEEEMERAQEEMHRALENMRIEIPKLGDAARGFRWKAFALAGGKPLLGVELVDTTPELREHFGGRPDAGILIGKVLPDSAAEKAGVKVGDLLLSVAGEPVETTFDVVEAVSERAGETVEIEVVRDGRARTLSVTLPEQDPEDALPRPRARMLVAPAPPAPPAPPAAPAAAPAPLPRERRMV